MTSTTINRTVAALRDAVGRGDLDALRDLLADDVRWAGNRPGGGCFNREHVLGIIRAQEQHGLCPQLDDERVIGDRVMVRMRLSPWDRAIEHDLEIWLALTVDGRGRVTELQDYASAAAAQRDLELRAGRPAGPTAPPVGALVPMIGVADVMRSVAFYELLGLERHGTYEQDGRVVWARMAHGRAELMLAEREEPLDPLLQGIYLYLYARDLEALRRDLVARGVTVGEIVDGGTGRPEMRVTDPDGYCLMVAVVLDA